jgi:hypothetical protein
MFKIVLTTIVFMTLVCTNFSCVDADAKVGVVGEQLTRIVDQNASISNKLNDIDELTQSFKQQLVDKMDVMHKEISAETINYGGAGWVVLGATAVVIVFLLAGIGIVLIFVRNSFKLKGLLTLVTSAIQNSPSYACNKVKAEIEKQTENGGPFGLKHKKMLREFTEKVGTFAVKTKIE